MKGSWSPPRGANEEADPLAIWKNDLKSAFGSVYRSSSLAALEKRNVRMAVQQACEWYCRERRIMGGNRFYLGRA